MNYAAVVFDVDGTLAESKMPMTPQMGELLARLAAKVPIAATTGTMFERFEEMVFPYFPADMQLERFYLMPTGGAAFYRYDGSRWITEFKDTFTPEEVREIENAIHTALAVTGIEVPKEPIGPLIELRNGASVNYAGLGNLAPLEAKKAWDPDRKKRIALSEVIAPLIPWALVQPAGTTTIDITRKGIDKAYGVRKLAEYLHTTPEQMLYVGDALFDGGNDAIVKTTGIKTRLIKDPAETMQVIEELLSRIP
jgi:HAD superfamily hydrolase (TIGR01484 family)